MSKLSTNLSFLIRNNFLWVIIDDDIPILGFSEKYISFKMLIKLLVLR